MMTHEIQKYRGGGEVDCTMANYVYHYGEQSGRPASDNQGNTQISNNKKPKAPRDKNGIYQNIRNTITALLLHKTNQKNQPTTREAKKFSKKGKEKVP